MTTQSDAVLEHGTFRLLPGTEVEAFVAAAEKTEDFLKRTGHVKARYLTCDGDGLWNDLIVWTSQDAARQAFEEVQSLPEFQAFFAPIDGESVEMRHPRILWQMSG
ncbi:MAG: hypothetical protein QNI90_10905 [Dinoroseobacter sp.]|nr:hypothetical protein [Dinoroseobacter sp.]